MIQRKKKICVECSKKRYIFSKGRCKFCASKTYKKPKQLSERTRTKNQLRSAVRSVYFDHHIALCKSSEESGTIIYNPGRQNICHLFDKGRHPSLQGNLGNYVYLTLEEHTLFDGLLFTHNWTELEKKFKNSWKIVCNRYLELLPLLEETTKFSLCLEKYLKND